MDANERKQLLSDLARFLREHLQMTFDVLHSVAALRKVLETDPQFQEKYKAALQSLATDESVRPNLARIGQVQAMLSKLDTL